MVLGPLRLHHYQSPVKGTGLFLSPGGEIPSPGKGGREKQLRLPFRQKRNPFGGEGKEKARTSEKRGRVHCQGFVLKGLGGKRDIALFFPAGKRKEEKEKRRTGQGRTLSSQLAGRRHHGYAGKKRVVSARGGGGGGGRGRFRSCREKRIAGFCRQRARLKEGGGRRVPALLPVGAVRLAHAKDPTTSLQGEKGGGKKGPASIRRRGSGQIGVAECAWARKKKR